MFLLFALLMTQLGRARNELEVAIAERTADLNRANEDLKLEIAERTRAEETLQRLSGDLLRSQDQERRRIARDLHDATAQNLASLKLALGQIDLSVSPSSVATHQLISESQLLVEQSIQELRTLSYVLHPPMLDESGLEAAIRHYIEGFARRSGIRVDLESSTSFGRLKPEFELALFRVIQESLTNIQRHSGAIQAKIRLERETDEVILEISDMGNAISAVALPFEIGVGISSMQERVRQIGGRLAIESGGLGTKIRVTLPTGS